jgi:interferon gamma-inducible protein 30
MNILYKSLVLVLVIGVSVTKDLPQIEVFVEALCPDCIDFIKNSLTVFQNNPDHLNLANVKFYPFGNGRYSYKDGKWQFTCQHGEDECKGNLYETCALNYLDADAGNNFMICFEGGRDWEGQLKKCVSDQALRAEITTCISSDEGNELQHQVAEHTPADHKWVPWITVNGVHDKEVEDNLLNDMTSYLCSLSQESLPGCKNTVNNHIPKRYKRCMKEDFLSFLQ